MKHAPFTHKHPSLAVSLRTRTRLWGTFNLAVALRGRSCGWGTCERPRRTFLAQHARPKNDTGLHFIEITTSRDAMRHERVWLRLGDPRPELTHDSEGRESGDV